MKNRNVTESFKNAFDGIKHAVLNERNFKIHIGATVLVMSATLFLDLSILEYLFIILVIAAVLQNELFNTAVESLVDLFCGNKFHELAKIAKDTAAAGVLISSICSVIIGGYIILKKVIDNIILYGKFFYIEKLPIYFPISVLIILTAGYIFAEMIFSFLNKKNFLNLVNILFASTPCILACYFKHYIFFALEILIFAAILVFNNFRNISKKYIAVDFFVGIFIPMILFLISNYVME